MISFLKKYQSEKKDDLVLSYTGNPSPEMINVLWQLAETRLNKVESRSNIKKRVIHIMIEILQNIFHHRENFITFKYDSFIFYLFKKSDTYLLVSGNYIKNERVTQLTDKLDNLNKLTTSQIRETYREVMGNGSFSEKGGAGLGLIDIIRKSGGKLNYDFKEIDQENSFFLLEIEII